MLDQTLPKFEGIASYVPCHAPWTPPDLPNINLNCQKTSFCEKVDFSAFGPGETLDKMDGFDCNFYYIEMSVYWKMLKSGLSDPMYHQIGGNFASRTVWSVRSSWKPLNPMNSI